MGRRLRGSPTDPAEHLPRGSRSSVRHWCTSAGCTGCCSASPRPAVRPVAALRTADVGRCGTPASSEGGVAGARRAARRSALRISADDLAGIRVVTCGTAPLSADDADAFTENSACEGSHPCGHRIRRRRRGMDAGRPPQVLVGQARQAWAGQPGGGCGWSRRGPSWAGPAGPAGGQTRTAGSGRHWVRTTDLARIDADGFLWILGRADQAIIRGGFKVLPDDVRAAWSPIPRRRCGGGRPRRCPAGRGSDAMVEPRSGIHRRTCRYLRNRLTPMRFRWRSRSSTPSPAHLRARRTDRRARVFHRARNRPCPLNTPIPVGRLLVRRAAAR